MNTTKKSSYIAVRLVVAVLIACGSVWCVAAYLKWSAERRAKEFCDATPVGSDISLAIQNFGASEGKKAHHFDSNRENGQIFIFDGFMFDKAECGVYTDKDGKVMSRKSYMLND